MKYIVRETHITCGKKNILMVAGRFMNVFGSASDFVDWYCYQFCSNVLRIFQVNRDGNLLLAPLDENLEDIPHLAQKDADYSVTTDS